MDTGKAADGIGKGDGGIDDAARDRAAHRAEISTHGVNSLILINGVAAIAVLALLQGVWPEGAESFAEHRVALRAVVSGILWFAIGAMVGTATHFARVEVSLARDEQRSHFKCWERSSYAMQVASATLFVIGCFTVVRGLKKLL